MIPIYWKYYNLVIIDEISLDIPDENLQKLCKCGII